jgi:hypothetical protein
LMHSTGCARSTGVTLGQSTWGRTEEQHLLVTRSMDLLMSNSPYTGEGGVI